MRRRIDSTFGNKTDQEVWPEVLSGSHRVWQHLVNKYANLIYGVCTFLGLSQADAADCFQQTWILLFQNRQNIKDPSRLSSWLVTTARREAIHILRKSEPAGRDSRQLDLADPALPPDRELVRIEQQHVLELALAKIDRPCQRVLKAFFFAEEDISYEEIAHRLDYSPNTLGAKRRRCLEKLKKIIIEDGYWDERNNR